MAIIEWLISRLRFVGYPFLLAGLFALAGCSQPGLEPSEDHDWAFYGGDPLSSKYSAVSQVGVANLERLKIAWHWNSPDNALVERDPALRPFIFEATPLAIDGVLYTSTSLNQVAAVDGQSGETLWIYDPGSHQHPSANVGRVSRGLAYWEGDDGGRLLLATLDAYLISIDAATGQPDPAFGDEGRVDLTEGLRRPVKRPEYAVTSPPIVVGDVVIVGSSIPDWIVHESPAPGDVRGFDVASGRQIWTFHSIPQSGEPGVETWQEDSWRRNGHTNAWSMMSADPETGYVYIPFGTASNDFYGGSRPGDNLFAESLVCLEAETGRRVWHFQMVHHGLWDYDLPAAPNLIDIVVDGRPIKAVAQVTKQGFCFVLDRLTGEPVWPVEERPVPATDNPGDRASPTQPFPTRPPPFERQGVTDDDLIDFTPELRQQAREILDQYHFGPLFTPPTEKPTLLVPGGSGGAYWAGAAWDPSLGYLFVPSINAPYVITLIPTVEGAFSRYVQDVAAHLLVEGPQGLPLLKPPYSKVTAIDLNRGETAWSTSIGEGPRNHPLLRNLDLPTLGSGGRSYVLATESLLFVAEGHSNRHIYSKLRGVPYEDCCENRPLLYALEKQTGNILWQASLPDFATGSPMTFVNGGRQYLVLAIGGMGRPAQLVAFSLEK